MAFKGEISVGMLNSLYKTGFSDGDVYRCYDSGNLVPNNFPVKHGDFVEWDSGKWIASDTTYTTSGDVASIAAEVLKKPGGGGTSIDYEDGYEVGKYYNLGGGTTIYQCTAIDDIGEDPRLIYFQKVPGVLSILNNGSIPLDDFGSKSDTGLTDNTLVIPGPNAYIVLTVTAATAITISANPGLGNFAVLIDNSANASDVTITVKDSTNTTTYLHSSAAGTDVASTKKAQLTCVGNCWTLAEFEA